MTPETTKVYPRLFTFSIKLEGHRSFFPASTYARTEEEAKEQIRGRFPETIVEWKLRKAPKYPISHEIVGCLPQNR